MIVSNRSQSQRSSVQDRGRAGISALVPFSLFHIRKELNWGIRNTLYLFLGLRVRDGDRKVQERFSRSHR